VQARSWQNETKSAFWQNETKKASNINASLALRLRGGLHQAVP
jgi:hypothetical protein